jgi:hypothetical protein
MTGSQTETIQAALEALRESGPVEFHHGGASGADFEASLIAERLGMTVKVHLAKAVTPRAFLTRNRLIVDLADELLAAPAGFGEELRSGTWATIRYARKRHKLTRIFWPDGTVGFSP